MGRTHSSQGNQRRGGRPWRRLRAWYLLRHPLCEHGLTGKGPKGDEQHVRKGREVDHKQPLERGGKELDSANLQTLCWPCHEAKTAKDRGYSQRPTIGEDGWPKTTD